ncbi:cell division protein SepF [Luteipulveratus sp. YIM 133132]|uniref:Cell division protein SepF n=1 Tax=Luteipulveratus flavus TaxID=3031728 RepID=A0ABT6C856_9MICO|nr:MULTISPECIES: cell division protein SepF [unclassified Luteipulveratus]MDE9366477.1 cell division protein SepF [Luteipulveratus sp. YIM 133132]MDF8264249.1 cell division protein SepF [Luteipulveratus sp. YIM 133296]
MAGALRKTMEYLGLAEVDPAHPDLQGRRDDYYYDDDQADYYDDEAAYDREPVVERSAEVTPLHQRGPAARPVRELHDSEVASLSRITTIHPRTYNEAKNIGESFRDGVPVIMNLSDMDDNDAKRLVDFAAGLVFGLHGSIERVTSKVFLLSPSSVEVATTGTESNAPRAALFNQS